MSRTPSTAILWQVFHEAHNPIDARFTTTSLTGSLKVRRRSRTYGEAIYKEGGLTEMVEQVLQFAGAQSGRRRYELRSTEVADFVAGALAACRAQNQERRSARMILSQTSTSEENPRGKVDRNAVFATAKLQASGAPVSRR